MASLDLQEKANFTRLSRLLVDKGTEALRNTFDAIHPPASLPAVLNANRTSLLRLKPRVINNSQWDLLFPPSGDLPDSKTFDVTLLTVLFRNICGLPSTGWGAMPVDTDRSMQANIVRLKSFRNEVYAHVTSTQVDNATFQSLWQKISQALVELTIPQNDIDDLETCSLGPEEEVYVEILKEWKSKEEDRVKVLECFIDRLTQITANLEKNYSKESDEDLLRKLAKHNFRGKIGRKAKLFHPGTREWLLKRVDKFVENEHESRMLLLTAGPGFGKSVFTAKVCEDFKKQGKLAASHFCDFSNSNLRDPMMMLQSLASQMCENIAGFKEKLLDQLRRPHQVQSLKDGFRIYLQNPLNELELEKTTLVVIDGLDESATDDKNEIVNLIDDYFPDLPECIKVLVTSRPEISVAKLSGVQKIHIDINDAKNNSDLEIYLKACLPSIADRKAEISWFKEYHLYDDPSPSVCKVLATKCEGSFLYAFSVQSELRKRDDLDKITSDEIIKFLPKGLDLIYRAYFKRFEDELKATMHDRNVLTVLKILATAKGSLPLTFLTRALGLAPDCRETIEIINKVNESISCLLYVSDDLVTVFHKSVIDWLLGEGYKDHEYTVKVSDGNKSLWLICEHVFEEIRKTVCSGDDLNLTNDVKYALDHGFQHLGACNMNEGLFWLVDVVIIHVLLTIYPQISRNYIIYLINIWIKTLQDSVVISDKLRERLLWHVFEIDFLEKESMLTTRANYLQSVLTHSPKGYFSDSEKEIAELLLPKVPRFVEYNCNEVEILPLVAWRSFEGSDMRSFYLNAVGLSHDKTTVAVAQSSKTIHVLSVPSLVKLWQYSVKYESISCCSFAPDDSFVLFGKLGTVLNIAKRKEVPFFHGNNETFTSCAFSPNGKRLVTSDGSTTIKLWDVAKRSLLSLLRANAPVNWCSFSSTGLFIIAYRESVTHSFCVWSSITWQRSDERNIRHAKLKVFKSRKCKRCFRPGFKELSSSKRLENELFMPLTFSGGHLKAWSKGIYNGVECSFIFNGHSLSVIENTHFTTLATWNLFVHIFNYMDTTRCFCKITAIGDDRWFYAHMEKLIVFKTLVPTQEQVSCPPRPTRVFSCSFSPDGSRLATCTSDGYINIWNVDTSQIEQRFKRSQGESSFACWWSKEFLFVFDIFDWIIKIPRLSKYPMDVNLKVLFTQSRQVYLGHLANEFVFLSAVVDFSEGLLSFKCGETNPVKVLDVSGVGGPRMVTLPGIEPGMSITVSPGASFVFGSNKDRRFIWKRTAEEPPERFGLTHVVPRACRKKTTQAKSYYNFGTLGRDFVCCFSNDCKVAVVFDNMQSIDVFELDGDDVKSGRFDSYAKNSKLFCINKDRIVISVSHHVIRFFDMDSGVLLNTSVQRYLTKGLLEQIKLSPKDTTIAFPKINGDMEFLRLCIPPDPLLSSIKREAANTLAEKRKEEEDLDAKAKTIHHKKLQSEDCRIV